MRNTIIVTVVLFIAVIGAAIYYFSDLNKEQKETVGPLLYLPENTLLISTIRNDEVTDNIFKDFELFDAMLGFKQAESLKSFKHQLLRSDVMKEYVQDVDIYISFHTEGQGIQTLFSIPTSKRISKGDLSILADKFADMYKVSQTDTLGQIVMALGYGNPDTTLFVTYYQDILFASPSKKLVTSVLNKQTKHLSSAQVEYFVKNSSRNTAFSVYFPHQQLDTIVHLMQQRPQGAFLNQFKGIQGQSAWHINFKQDALMLSGETEVESADKNYMALFRNQFKTSQHLYNYFPANTALYLEYSLSNRTRFDDDLAKLFEKRDEKNKVANALKAVGKSEQSIDSLKATLGNSFALVELSNQTNIGFIHLSDSTLWKIISRTLLDNSADSISRFTNSNLLYALYGDAFKVFQRPYVTRIEDVLVVANTHSTLLQYMSNWKSKNLLTGTLGFKNFERLQGNEANVTFFIHTKNANNKVATTLTPSFRKNFTDKSGFGYQDFYSWSAQLSGNNGNFLTQIYAVYKSKTALGATADWSYALNNKAITRPYVFAYADTSQFILLQELDHTIHAIHPSGKKMWSAVFSGRVVGDMIQLADRTIVAVTDRNRLYRFDTDGRSLDGFSVGLADEPSGTPSIVDIDGRQVILVPTNNKVYAYELDGSRVSGWTEAGFEGKIVGSVIPWKDSFAFATTYGRLILLDKSGKKGKEIDIPGDIEFRNPFGLLDKGNGEVLALLTDTSSNFYRVLADGSSTRFKIEGMRSRHFSDFININSSSSPEMILMDGSRLRVFDVQDSLKLLFEYNFTKNIEHRPQYFYVNSNSSALVGVASRSTNLLYVFTENGQVVDGFPVEGQPLFYYGKINYNSDVYLLCMRRDNKLHAFRQQK